MQSVNNARRCGQPALMPIMRAGGRTLGPRRCGQPALMPITRVGVRALGPCRCDCGLGEYALGGAPKGAPQDLGKENQDCACSFGVAVMMVSPKATGPASAGVIAANFFLLVTTTGVTVS